MGTASDSNIILLFDYYNPDSEKLLKSFKAAGYEFPAVAIEDDGFLDDDVESVYSAFLGDYSKSKDSLGRPRYFNEIKIPKFWEITATGTGAKVMNHAKERANIVYREPLHRRFIRAVDWKDEEGVVRSTDFYNKYGVLYARMAFNQRGEKVNKAYFTYDGKEAIVENFVTGDIIINDGDIVKIFKSKTDVVMYFLEKRGYTDKRLFINSLSTPFFVSQRLPRNGFGDVLFWQEPRRNDIPGNMQMIFDGQSTRTGQVFVQKKAAFDKLIELGASPDMTGRLGFVYPFERENSHGKEALICTNSDNIAHLEDIIKALPEVVFHITAVTEMSAKLLSMGKYENAKLYPGVKTEVVDNLFKKCDYYFDINYENEILSALEKAFMHNLAIYAFNETKHTDVYAAAEHTYAVDDYERLINDVKAALEDEAVLDRAIELQHEAALAEEPQAYVNMVER